MKTQRPVRESGFTLLECVIIAAVLAVLTGMYLSQAMRPRRHSHPPNCTNNLKQIGLAFQQWALDNGDRYPMRVPLAAGGTMELIGGSNVFPHFLVMSNELNTPMVLACPEDKTRKITKMFTTNFSDANISYFVGADAKDTMPQMFLAGDCNFKISGKPVPSGIVQLGTNCPVGWTKSRHKGPEGKVALVDGSVQSLNSARVRAALANSGDATNRLVIPALSP
jgi:type II secretory pathway pseudopilin PulG